MGSKRVVVLMKHFLGDAVMATPLIDGLIDEGADVTIAAMEPVFSLLRAPDRPFETLALSRSRKLADNLATVRALRKGRFDVAIAVNRSFRSALQARLAGIPVRCGHQVDRRQWLLTASLPYDKDKSEIECYCELARLAGFEVPYRHPSLTVTDEERGAGHCLLLGASVAIQVGASAQWKRLPVVLLRDLVRRWHARGKVVALMGGKDEFEARDEFLNGFDIPVIDLIGKTSIRETMGVLANLEKIVGGDTGLMHVAAGLGTATVTVFATQNPSKWGHDYPPHYFLQAPGGETVKITYEMLGQPADP